MTSAERPSNSNSEAGLQGSQTTLPSERCPQVFSFDEFFMQVSRSIDDGFLLDGVGLEESKAMTEE